MSKAIKWKTIKVLHVHGSEVHFFQMVDNHKPYKIKPQAYKNHSRDQNNSSNKSITNDSCMQSRVKVKDIKSNEF